MLMILARLVRSESFWAVAKVRSPHTGPGIRYIIVSARFCGIMSAEYCIRANCERLRAEWVVPFHCGTARVTKP